MKITFKQYAQVLYEIMADKDTGEIKDDVKKFIESLAKNEQLKKAHKIMIEFVKIWNKEKGIVEAEAISARELDKDIVKLLNNYIVKLSGAKEVLISEKINKDILGGVVIKYGDRVVDGSLKSRVIEFKNSLVK
ncbi:ATP synthase F1 subunit delta [Candidatus Falkowbacteria bacterium]|nr:ATP synthase F1 subunit delta [Candidatus Falkowbacteria bacterium]